MHIRDPPSAIADRAATALRPGLLGGTTKTAAAVRQSVVAASMSDDVPWLSFLLPVHNIADYLQECVDSILGQHAQGIEVLLLDDASTDRSNDIIGQLQRCHAPIVRTFRHPVNRGLSAARNSLLAEARGRYVWFLDADDVLRPGAVAGLARAVAAGSADLVLCDFRVVRENATLKHRLRGERHRRTFRGPARRLVEDHSKLVAGLLVQGELHAWTKIAKRDVWRAAPFPEGRYFEDMAVIPALLGAARTHYYVPEPWVGYRQRSGSIMATGSLQKMRDQLSSLTELHAGLTASGGLDEQAVFALEHFCLKTHASLARRLLQHELTDTAELLGQCRSSLASIFPAGIEGILGQYLRRGWLLRAWRTRLSLQRLGLV